MAHSKLIAYGFMSVLAFCGLAQFALVHAEYPGVIELVGYSNRRARTRYIPSFGHARDLDSPTQTLSAPSAKTQADIETVKQNIEKYNKLLTLDTKNLPESQKDMLERIVERVARLKESLDIEENPATGQPVSSRNFSTNDANTQTTNDGFAAATTEDSTMPDLDTEPTVVLDQTTLMQLQDSMNELAAAQTTFNQDLATTTELNLQTDPAVSDITEEQEQEQDEAEGETGRSSETSSLDYVSTTNEPLLTDATDIDDQFVAARSNNNIGITAADTDSRSNSGASSTLSTAAGNHRTVTTASGKLQKTRATKRPTLYSSSTKAANAQHQLPKRGGGGSQRPSVASSSSTMGGAMHKQTTASKQKASSSTATITTAMPQQYNSKLKHQQQQYYQHKMSDKNPVTMATVGGTVADQRIPQANIAAPTTTYGSGVAGNNNAAITNSYQNTNTNDMVYDDAPHVNTSAIIDSLNHAREEYYQQKPTVNNKDKKPSATAKPTKYHYYPHNQHIYLLPECAIQQVCNAVYVRLNYTQPLCACPSRYRDPCSASLNEDDQHTTKLVGDGKKKAITLAKTCEATTEMRECRSPKDWSLLALQNTRTGKSHYLVICRCPDHFKMEGPMAHDQPTYATVPGIRVFGMMCVQPGYSLRKPSSQPPKRYQLHKPYYRPSSQTSYISGNNQYTSSSSNKDNYGRPSYGSSSSNTYHSDEQSYQNPHHQSSGNYQYLNRPESSHSSSSSSNYRPATDTISINNFPGGIYGRNNERNGDAPIEAATEDDNKILLSTSTQPSDDTRTTPALSMNEEKVNESVSDDGNTVENAAATAAATSSEAATVTAAAAAAPVSPLSVTAVDPATVAAAAATVPSEEIATKREKRSVVEEFQDIDYETPEFPWDRVLEFQQSIIWD